jgi:hypothetical protein
MKKNQLIRELSNAGIELGACIDGIAELDVSASDCRTLAGLFFKNAHFCLNAGFPTAGWINDHFGEEAAEYGIYCGENGKIQNGRKVAILGDADVTAEYNDFSVGKIYVKNNSTLNVDVTGNARIFIDAFDNSVVTVCASGNSRVYINQFGSALINIDRRDGAQVVNNVKSVNKY